MTYPVRQYHEQPGDVALGVRKLLHMIGEITPWGYCSRFTPPVGNILEEPNYIPREASAFPFPRCGNDSQ